MGHHELENACSQGILPKPPSPRICSKPARPSEPGHAPRSRDHLIVLGQTPLQRDAVSVLAVALVRVVFSAPVPMARADSGGGVQTVRQTA